MLPRAAKRLIQPQTLSTRTLESARGFRVIVGGDQDLLSIAKAANKLALYERSVRIDKRIRANRFFTKPTLRRTRAKDNEKYYKGVQDVRKALRDVLRKERTHLGF